MIYKYQAIDQMTGAEQVGTIDAATADVAISVLQRRKLIIVNIVDAGEAPAWKKILHPEKKPTYKEVVILSRQISTLFNAQVSALRVFQLLGSETDSPVFRVRLEEVTKDIQGGMSLSQALSKHPDMFSDFYVNMVKAGEESGNLSSTFSYLADYLDRSYELVSKTKNALIYPAFVVTIFIVVMVLMLVIVVPKLAVIIQETPRELPIYTKVVIAASNFMLHYGIYLAVALVLAGFFFYRFLQTEQGKRIFAEISLSLPYIGTLYRKLYLARIADNLNTMLTSGIAAVRAVEISASVVGNEVYRSALDQIGKDVRTGVSLSGAMARHPEIPGMMVQMIRVGEETGEVGNILATLAAFYKREVDNAVDTMIGLIEPAMIIMLGLGVGGLLVSILLPIYDITMNAS